jgi:hypothetical protein
MLKNRAFWIVPVDKRHGARLDESAEPRAVGYSGEQVRVKLP